MPKALSCVGKAVGSVVSRIQGITVENGGDTTKLSTALSKVNKEIRDTQSQLKDVNKLLKLDPGNAELLAQAVSETKENLDALKLAGQQADKSAVALQKIGATGEKLKNVGFSIEGVGKKLMPVTAAVGGLGASVVKIALDFDSSMSKVRRCQEPRGRSWISYVRRPGRWGLRRSSPVLR